MKRLYLFRAIIFVGVFAVSSPYVAADDWGGTFSIVAYDSLTGELGVAVQSKAFTVGAAVAWAEANVGAIATQASTNESFGPNGLELLRSGLSAEEVLGRLLSSDPGKEDRQVGIIDAVGNASNFTGSRCIDWAGGVVGQNFACQGNILASEDVVKAMAMAFKTTEGELSERLLQTLVAAQTAGGDKRGMQSAALLVVRPSENYPEYRYRYVDLRVEDHPDPINELIRLFRIYEATDLLEAHSRYIQQYESEGTVELAQRERRIVGVQLRQTLVEETDDADLLNSLAWFCATGDMFLDEALEAAKRAVSLEPNAAHIVDTLAEVYFRLGMIDRAVEAGERARVLDPESTYYSDQLKRFKDALHTEP